MEKYKYYSVGLPAIWWHQENQQGGLLFFDEQVSLKKQLLYSIFTGISSEPWLLMKDMEYGIYFEGFSAS